MEDSALFISFVLEQQKGNFSEQKYIFFRTAAISQIIFLLDKYKILKISQELGGERYIKKFDIWHHLNSMLYATISRLDSLREIEMAMIAESRKLSHLGLTTVPKRSTLADANEKRPESIFGAIYANLYNTTKASLLSDSRTKDMSQWMKKLLIIDSTTISLFSDLIFKGVGRNPKTGKKKGGLKVHSILRAFPVIFNLALQLLTIILCFLLKNLLLKILLPLIERISTMKNLKNLPRIKSFM